MSRPVNDNELELWPDCSTPDCENKASVRLHSLYCHPCTLRLNAKSSAPKGYFDKLMETQWISSFIKNG